MMRHLIGGLVAAAMVAAACGGGPTASQSAAPQATQPGTQPDTQPTAGQPTPAGTPVQPPGSATVVVVLTGGQDAGTYTGSADPLCSHGLIGPSGWGVQYSITEAADNQLSSLQLVSAAPGMENDDNAMFTGTSLLMTVTIGELFGDASRSYEVEVNTDTEESSGTGSAQVTDSGSTAVIHATGTTADGVGIDATVNCPTVVRQ